MDKITFIESRLTDKQLSILSFVKKHHEGQTRKYTGEPYYYHLLNVAEILRSSISNYLSVEVALCHDLFEDTKCTRKELTLFLTSIGYNSSQSKLIVSYVKELTDVYTHEAYPNLNRLERKSLESKRLSEITATAQTVKYADLIDNSESIFNHDKKFAVVYLDEKKQILKGMRNGNFDLHLRACAILYNSLHAF